VPDNVYKIRAILARWIAQDDVQVVITTGGTGITGRDTTPEAVKPLLDKEIEGFGEMFRNLSYEEIKTSTLQSRAVAGVANGTFIFCLPGSSGQADPTAIGLPDPSLQPRGTDAALARIITWERLARTSRNSERQDGPINIFMIGVSG
jgi:molybdenum cofactor biosynthesis protein B